MEKICFECGIKGKTWTGPVFTSADKLVAFYRDLGVSDPIVEKMQDRDLLCSKCSGKAECRHALKCYNYYKEKWTSEQYEIWAKNNTNLISIAETELKEQEKTAAVSSAITPAVNIPNETKVKVEKFAIIGGTPIQNGQEELENLIEQTINGAILTIPAYMDEIKENKQTLKVEDPKEFLYGMVMGMALGMGGAFLSAQKEAPTTEDQIKVRDIIYKNIPQIRERIFNS